MKRIISVLLIFILTLSASGFAFAYKATDNSDFEITEDGVVTAYYGEEWVVVPEEIDGIPVKKIGEKAFFDLGISDVYLSEGISEIDRSAFEGCNVNSIELPSTITNIGTRTFANCAYLRTIFVNFDENAEIGADAFFRTGHLLFYVNCDVKIEALSEKIRRAKGDNNFIVSIRHTESDYDDEGNVVCNSCGFKETEGAGAIPFDDVAFDAWYYDYVVSAYLSKIIGGKSPTKFDPNGNMTCAEAAKIAACICAIFGKEVQTNTQGPWYQAYVDYCYENGIIAKQVTFDWNRPITRAQMAYIFSRCDPFENWYDDINNVPITDIPDVYDESPFAYEILALYNKGIAVGSDGMKFYPDSNIKRSEAAAIIARITDWNMRIELPKG